MESLKLLISTISISKKESELLYYMFNEPALNGFSKTISTKRQTEEYQIVNTIDVSSFSLSKILNEHLPFEQKIDFLSVDVEPTSSRI